MQSSGASRRESAEPYLDLASLRGAKRRSNPALRPGHRWIASRSLSSGAHSRDPLARNDGTKTRHIPNRHRPRKRAIQYSEASVMESIDRSVLDTPLEPVIGLAGGETRWRSMTVLVKGCRPLALPKNQTRRPAFVRATGVFRDASQQLRIRLLPQGLRSRGRNPTGGPAAACV